ncbi:uncharacterized protein [Medicago truncatula]|uniref:uncharacterized protein isoform X3 n=1 Tax=Medicago truncatula TaxID=3880 RepID=UPI000D2F1F4C|nr:uncharacterized protein LOC11424203 isoform X3 [Medicago truncatula]
MLEAKVSQLLFVQLINREGSYRRKYMNLYKIKLDFLQQEQPVDDDVLQDLEQMEKETDLDDILNYRSAAEFEMQEYLSRYSTPSNGRIVSDISTEKSGNDEHNVKSRGWLNWLSRGMLGAGGTDDSSQFSGVVSYDVKDISEATEFHPLVSSSVDVATKHELCIFESNIEIHQISVTLFSKKHCKGIAEIIFEGGVVESKLYKEHGIIISKFNSGKLVEPNSKETFVQIRQPNIETNVLNFVDHSCYFQVNFSSNRDVGNSVKGMLQQLQVTFDANILLNVLEFYGFVTSVKSYSKRVLLSLNGIENETTRLLSKAEYVGVNHGRVMWDVSIFDISVNFPWRNTASECSNMVIMSRSLCFKSKIGPESFLSEIGDQPYFLKNFSNTISTSNDCSGVRFQDLYNYIDVKLNDFKITIVNSDQSQKISILEKFAASFFMAFCVIPDESILKQLEVYMLIESLKVHFSHSIYGAFIELRTHMDSLLVRGESEIVNRVSPSNIVSDVSAHSTFGISIISRLGSVDLEVDLENRGDKSSVLMVSLQEIYVRYASAEFQELFISTKSLMIRAYEVKEEKDDCFVLLSVNLSSPSASVPAHSVPGPSIEFDQYPDDAMLADACFAMHYESPRTDLVCHKCFIYLNNADIHCYPHIVGLVVGFFHRLSAYSTSSEKSTASNTVDISKSFSCFGLQKFGFSNYFEVGYADSACIPFDCFPFVTIYNSGPLDNLESSLVYAIPDWRKYFTLRDRKIISPKSFRVSSSKCKSDFGNLLESGIARMSNYFSIELQLFGIRAHFHDSSCIIGSITIPTCKSSLSFCDDNMDILSSSEGLVLTSSWGPHNFQDYLWGPATANLSPILNVRVRKTQNKSSAVDLEVCFGIQHVYCMLPSEYLSIIIGYFSLSDWGGYSGDQFPSDEQGDIVLKNEMNITYKFEILDSDLVLPVENNEHRFLKLELPQIYCSFIVNSGFDDVLKNIPTECLVPIHKLAQRNNCLNIFGRDLNISFLLYTNNILGLGTNEWNTEFVTISLIAPLNADVWVRIPLGGESNYKSSSSICLMTCISSCHIIAEDIYFFDGCMALWDVIEGFSSIDDQSNCFKTDVLQFLQSKRSLKATGATSSTLMPSNSILTEVKCCTQSLMISFCHRHEGFVEPISKSDLQFTCSASLVDDSLVWLDLRFSRLVIFSSHDSVLAKCASTSCSMFVLGICFSKSIDNMNELSLCLSSLDIWLHLSEWTEIVNFLNHLYLPSEKTPINAASEHLSVDTGISIKEAEVKDDSSFHDSESTSIPFTIQDNENAVLLIIRSENVRITFHIPIWTSEEPHVELQHAKRQNLTTLSVPSDILEEKDAEFLTVSIEVNGFELVLRNRDIQLKSNIERLSSVMTFVVNGSHTSLPLLDIVQVHMDAVLSKSDTGNTTVNMELICDHSDVWLSHPAFYLCGALKFDGPKSESSQNSTGSISFKFQLRKVSVLLTDGKWSYNGPQLEILVRSILFHASACGKHLECSFTGDLQVNYKNIGKVAWEPFVEPWHFLFTMVRDQEISILPNRSLSTDIILESTTQLNINITESLVECVSRTAEMLDDALGLMGLKDHEGNKLLHPPCSEYIFARKCVAPYVIQNLTSAPLLYHVYHGHINPNDIYDLDINHAKCVQPGSASTIYMDENADQLSHYRPYHSSDSLNEQRSSGLAHRYIMVQLEGTSMPSNPISMDLVGLTCFDANFSKSYNENGNDGRMNTAPTFVVPVVLDVSALRYSKLIRVYSTVVLLNATSTSLELRFDIPFGVAPRIFDPIHPGQQFPLPLHLAEAGCVRWRPVGNSYLWSEAHKLSNLLSLNTKVGNFKSFICYPSHPSSHPYRCCISVKSISLTSSGRVKNNLLVDDAKKHYIHHLILSAPLVINNFLPKEILLISKSGGVDHTARISEVETSIYHIDPSHDLGLEIYIDGFKCCDFKFPRLETFCTVAKFSETKFSLSETLIFESNNSSGHIYVTAEKVMDAYSGSRELIIFVPFILYNCMGFPLCVKEASSETDERGFVIPSYYDAGVNETFSDKKDGLSLLASNNGLHASVSREPRSYLDSHTISCRRDDNPNSVFFGNYRGNLGRQKRKSNSSFQSSSFGRLKNTLSSGVQSTWNYSGSCNNEHERVVPFMYSPSPTSSVNDIFVKMSGCFSKDARDHMPYSLWSNSFSLLPQSGSSTIFVPHLTSNSAFILAVTSISVAEPYGGRTNAIAFQPRYVISNACSKEIIYKQKGTDVTFYLGIGEHAHLHWTDTSRELLVSICYNETGWQWSGSFLPDHLGDTQLKMRNFVLGTSSMIRVEVQNADISMGDEKIVGNIKGNSGTNLILLSDDDTGYMPYRIDNFSKEILRIYQQRCEVFDTVIHSYASNPYTWDEPSYPHRLVVEVPGERVLGMYALDDVKEYMPVQLPSTSEKPERIFFVSVHAEGATKVLSVLDSNYHIFNEVKKPSVPNATEKRLYDHNQVRPAEYKDKISISIPCIGISLINSYPQELLFACINDIQINLLQSLDRQRLSMRISFIQIDNQLRSTPYPVMLSFNGGYRSRQVDYTKFRDDATRSRIEKSNQMNFSSSSSSPVFCLEISKWKKKDTSFLSFEHIKLRMADFRLEIEQEVILSLFEFFTNISSGMQYGTKPSSNQYYGTSLKDSSSVQTSENFRLNGDQSPLGFAPIFNAKSKKIASLPSIVPIGAPWQEIYLLARTQKKVYIEMFELAPIKLTLSFSSAPWMLRNRILTSKEFLIHRGLMALADVEGAHIYLKDITIAHHTASWESIQEILIRHYNRQLLHETYKLFGSAGVIGNPLGFARSMGHGIRDFLSVPANNIMRSPTGLIMGMAEGTTSLLSNTLYAVSDAASQFSKVARKGIVAFTYDDQIASRIEKQQATVASDSKGVINEVLEGLTGLLQSPIRGAEKHGLPGVLSGVALGITGLVAKPAASILEVTGKTAQSIRNRSKPNQLRSHRFRVRLPRSLSHEFPLRSYSWDEAVGASVLVEADDGLKFKDEKLMACKALKEAGKFVVLTERYIMTVFSPSLRDLGKPEFCGIPSDLEWIIEWEIGLESIIHADCAQVVIHIVGSRPDSSFMHDQHSPKRSSKTKHVRYIHYPTHLPLPQTDIELAREEDAANLLQLLLSGIEKGKGRAWDCGRILHRANMKQDAV